MIIVIYVLDLEITCNSDKVGKNNLLRSIYAQKLRNQEIKNRRGVLSVVFSFAKKYLVKGVFSFGSFSLDEQMRSIHEFQINKIESHE